MFPQCDGDFLDLITGALIGIDRDGSIVFRAKSAEAMLDYPAPKTNSPASGPLS